MNKNAMEDRIINPIRHDDYSSRLLQCEMMLLELNTIVSSLLTTSIKPGEVGQVLKTNKDFKFSWANEWYACDKIMPPYTTEEQLCRSYLIYDNDFDFIICMYDPNANDPEYSWKDIEGNPRKAIYWMYLPGAPK